MHTIAPTALAMLLAAGGAAAGAEGAPPVAHRPLATIRTGLAPDLAPVLAPEEVLAMAERETIPPEVLAPVAPFPLWGGGPLPESAEIPLLADVEFQVIKPYEFDRDGYRFLHGVALAWHQGRLYASFGHNRGGENTDTEEARGRVSDDGGRTWGEVFTLDPGEPGLGVSHGVFLPHGGRLWAFHGAYHGTMERVHTRAYVLDEDSGRWLPRGTVVEGGFWPLQPPLRLADGQWIMAGISVGGGNPAAVAICRDEDLLRWELVVIPKAPEVGTMWGESAVLVHGSSLLNLARYGEQALALAALSEDGGRTWTPAQPSNLPMAASKPCAGTLSNGEHYLIGTTTADSGNRRSPLTLALTRPGEVRFSRVVRLRDAVCAGPGESHPGAALAYPYAVEHAGRLYVGYSNSGGGVGRRGQGRELWNNNSAELAIIPLSALAGAP
jgi:hypothetical protein